MRLRFNEVKATQAASRLLRLRGGRMSYLKLIKLLYIIDREALIRWGRTVTTDRHVSMPKGPVVSQIYDLITGDEPPNEETFWRQHVSSPQDFEIQLQKDPGDDELSNAEEALIDEIFDEHGHKSRWELVRLTHDLPEWQDPCGGSIPIAYRDILRAANKTEAEIAAVESEIESLAVTQALVA
ncbi:MAG: Panacea domain-containing protein, partial [Bryobacteraceae bacterium]